jgi:drug/metabolite transporter (DMT)-like permease
MLTAALAAVVAAAFFAVASAFQHRSAGLVAGALRRTRLVAFFCAMLRHPLWIIGSFAAIVGAVLHAVALRDGPLTLVQPLLVTSVVFALPLRAWLEGHKPRRAEVGWAVALTLGLAFFFAIAVPGDATAQASDAGPTIVAAALIAPGIIVCTILGRRASGGRAASLLAAAAALAFAAGAGLLKEVMGLLNEGIMVVGSHWPVYALVVIAVVGLVLNQLAYSAGPLSSSLPVLSTVDPVVSLIIGVAVFDEPFRNSPLDLLGESVGLAIVLLAAVRLTQSRSPAALPTNKTKIEAVGSGPVLP